ncbi:MAG TPA: hypothetical protein VLA49_04975 [Anaerolineales bacterium]|nr:hypothetical protein [Anaerolineales bacterium]
MELRTLKVRAALGRTEQAPAAPLIQVAFWCQAGDIVAWTINMTSKILAVEDEPALPDRLNTT